jgi:hypothetical protein
MSHRAAKTTQADIARAIRAAKQAGLPTIVEIQPDGTIRLLVGVELPGINVKTVATKKEIVL